MLTALVISNIYKFGQNTYTLFLTATLTPIAALYAASGEIQMLYPRHIFCLYEKQTYQAKKRGLCYTRTLV